jgi:plasmid maintenance system antidote protein VapI
VTPNYLLNKVSEKLGCDMDKQLARRLDCNHSTICRLRTGQLQISSNLLIKIYDATGWSIEYIRELARGKNG